MTDNIEILVKADAAAVCAIYDLGFREGHEAGRHCEKLDRTASRFSTPLVGLGLGFIVGLIATLSWLN